MNERKVHVSKGGKGIGKGKTILDEPIKTSEYLWTAFLLSPPHPSNLSAGFPSNFLQFSSVKIPSISFSLFLCSSILISLDYWLR